MPEPSRPWFPTLIGFILGLAIAAVGILEDQHKLPGWDWPGFNGLLFIPALYAAIAVHELGHLVAGKLVGLDTGGIAVGGFVFMKSGNNWTFRFDRHIWTGGFFKPLTRSADFHPSRYAWMIAAGPLASAALAAVCVWAFVHSGNGPWKCLGTLFWCALLTLMLTMLPFSSGLNKSDGAQILGLLRDPERARSWMALLSFQTEEVRGLRPREWDAQLFERLLAIDAKGREFPYCQLMAFYRRVDEGCEPAALQHLENALARSLGSGKLFRHVLYLEAASASARIRKRPDQARIWRDRSCKLRRPRSLHAVQAEIAMCEGRYLDAAQDWEAAISYVIRRRLDSGLIRFAKEKWTEQAVACRALCSDRAIRPAGRCDE